MIENVQTHFKIKISFPVIIKWEIIFVCDHTYIFAYFNFYFCILVVKHPVVGMYGESRRSKLDNAHSIGILQA